MRTLENETNRFSLVSDCPACYREVQKRVNRYRGDLNLLQNAISTLNSSQTLNSLREDKRLTNELDGLAKNLNNLKVDLQREWNDFECLDRTWSCLGAGLISRNTSDYDEQDTQFRSNMTDFETRYRKLERELPDFIAQNERIRDTLQKANDTFRTESSYQLGMLSNRAFIFSSHSVARALPDRIKKLLQKIDPVARRSDAQHESAINKTVIMQTRIDQFQQTFKNLQKSYDDALNYSQTAENMLSGRLMQSESLVRDQLENNMKQKLVSSPLFCLT